MKRGGEQIADLRISVVNDKTNPIPKLSGFLKNLEMSPLF